MNTKDMQEAITFDDVYLLPDYSTILTRKSVDLSSELLPGLRFDIPLLSANMNMVTESKMIEAMTSRGASAALHRYLTKDEFARILAALPKETYKKFGISLGVDKSKYMEYLSIIHLNEWWDRVGYIIIDVAHGHHILVKETLKDIKIQIPTGVPILAGNVCTRNGARDLADWGADGIKVGIGGGSMCKTRTVAGVGCPQLSSIIECKKGLKEFYQDTGKKVTLIADGGFKESGDFVKALAAGADFIMSGSLFAGTKESPGNVLSLHGNKKVKIYQGMASTNAQVTFFNKEAEEITPEGIATLVEYKGTVHRVINRLIGGMQSGFSYCGCKNVEELREYGSHPSSWVKITTAGYYEGLPHGGN